MLKVSRILRKAKRLKRASLYGWIKADGTYSGTLPFASHAYWSAKELGIKWNGESEDYTHAFDAGWIRVTGGGASCKRWNNTTFKMLQMTLLREGESGAGCYYLDLGNDVWSHGKGLMTTIDDILVAKNWAALEKMPVGSDY